MGGTKEGREKVEFKRGEQEVKKRQEESFKNK